MKRIALYSIPILLSLCSFAAACPMCRDSAAINNGSGGSPPAAIFNASVLCILAGFLIVLALLIAKIVGAIRLVDHPQQN